VRQRQNHRKNDREALVVNDSKDAVMKSGKFVVGLGVLLVGQGVFASGKSQPAQTFKSDSAVRIVDLPRTELNRVDFAVIKDEPFMISTANAPTRGGGVDNFVSADKKVSAGLSKFKKVTLKLTNWPVDEIMFILDGEVEITDLAGHGRIYKPGDAFVMPKGFSGTWHQLSDIKKIQVVYNTAQ
jgi:uncharacterized cupin superfamily protein